MRSPESGVEIELRVSKFLSNVNINIWKNFKHDCANFETPSAHSSNTAQTRQICCRKQLRTPQK